MADAPIVSPKAIVELDLSTSAGPDNLTRFSYILNDRVSAAAEQPAGGTPVQRTAILVGAQSNDFL